MNQITTAGLPALTFQQTTFDVVDLSGTPWLRLPQIGIALGYSNPYKVQQVYDRNSDEFTEAMTALVKLPSAGGAQDVRIFSLRGAYLLGMLSRTKKAKAFRVWVLDAPQGLETAAPAPQRAPTESLADVVAQRDALLEMVREQQLEAYPYLRKALRYHHMPGLNYQEKATLMGWKSTTAWTECLRKMAVIGLIVYTPDPKLQQNSRAAMAKLRATQGAAAAPAQASAPKAPRKGSIRPRRGDISPQQEAHLEKMRLAAAASRARKRANLEAARAALGAAAAKGTDDDKLH